jgi:hypothetical protein
LAFGSGRAADDMQPARPGAGYGGRARIPHAMMTIPYDEKLTAALQQNFVIWKNDIS